MNKNFLIATVVGAVTLFVVGGVFYGVLADFFANDVSKAVPIWWALGLGELLYAAVLTLVLGWKGVASVGSCPSPPRLVPRRPTSQAAFDAPLLQAAATRAAPLHWQSGSVPPKPIVRRGILVGR